jgi:hypothetical protein
MKIDYLTTIFTFLTLSAIVPFSLYVFTRRKNVRKIYHIDGKRFRDWKAIALTINVSTPWVYWLALFRLQKINVGDLVYIVVLSMICLLVTWISFYNLKEK